MAAGAAMTSLRYAFVMASLTVPEAVKHTFLVDFVRSILFKLVFVQVYSPRKQFVIMSSAKNDLNARVTALSAQLSQNRSET